MNTNDDTNKVPKNIHIATTAYSLRRTNQLPYDASSTNAAQVLIVIGNTEWSDSNNNHTCQAWNYGSPTYRKNDLIFCSFFKAPPLVSAFSSNKFEANQTTFSRKSLYSARLLLSSPGPLHKFKNIAIILRFFYVCEIFRILTMLYELIRKYLP